MLVLAWGYGKSSKTRSEGNMPGFGNMDMLERRTSRRVLASEVIPQGTTRLATGEEVGLVNISLSGAILITTKDMLPPGSVVRLGISIPDAAIDLKGRVQRCRVVGLKQAKIQYEAAVILEGGFPPPLAEKLRHLDEHNPPTEQSSLQDTSPDKMKLPDKAQIWILNPPDAGAGI